MFHAYQMLHERVQFERARTGEEADDIAMWFINDAEYDPEGIFVSILCMSRQNLASYYLRSL